MSSLESLNQCLRKNLRKDWVIIQFLLKFWCNWISSILVSIKLCGHQGEILEILLPMGEFSDLAYQIPGRHISFFFFSCLKFCCFEKYEPFLHCCVEFHFNPNCKYKHKKSNCNVLVKQEIKNFSSYFAKLILFKELTVIVCKKFELSAKGFLKCLC